MKKVLFFVGIYCMMFIYSHAQNSFSMKLYAGSNASWGQGQYVSIDEKGAGKYTLSDVGKGVIDSISFNLTKTQLVQLENAVNGIQFFKLNPTYNAKSRDGIRLSVKVSVSGKTNTVHWINTHPAETIQLLDKLNATLSDKGIIIHY